MAEVLTLGREELFKTTKLGDFVRGNVFLSVLLLLAMEPVWAQNSCQDLFKKIETQVAAPKRVVLQASNDNSLVRHFEDVVTELSSLLGFLKKPSVDVVISPKSVVTSFYAFFTKKIMIGQELDTRSPWMRDVILAHEYGHAVFTENFRVVFQGQQMTLRELIDMARMEAQAFKEDPRLAELDRQVQEIEQTIKLAQAAKNTEVENLLKEQHQVLVEMRAPYQQAYDAVMKLHDIHIPYNELFADSLAVLWKQDPHAMATVVHKLNESAMEKIQELLVNRSNNPNAPPPRDFVLTNIETWKHELNDKYTQFDPARGMLWELYMKGLPKEKIPVFIKTFLESVSTHLSERQKRGEDLNHESQATDLVELNREFIRIFVSIAEANGLGKRSLE